MKVDAAAAREFLRTHARVLEVRLAEVYLDDATPEHSALAAIDALRAYQNSDGGFGHGLEADAAAPDSQPLGVDFALTTLTDVVAQTASESVRARAAESAAAALPFLASVAGDDGGVPIVLPSVATYPRAAHWGDGRFDAALNPTAAIVACARDLDLAHPWLDKAADFCRQRIDSPRNIDDAHTAFCVLRFLESGPDNEWARDTFGKIGESLSEIRLFQPTPEAGYGLTPLQFAPRPDSPRRRFFTDAAVDAHLEALAAAQLDDGGWPISWEPPGPAAVLAWRGVVTLNALRVLQAYGRI